MTPDEFLVDETRKWVRQSSQDLHAAGKCAPELPAPALFHCQQAAEKLLKAFLTWNQKAFRKTHELGELASACAEIDATLGPALEPGVALSKYAWQFRYPGAPYEPDADEAAQGLALARHVRTEIVKRLPKGATVDLD